MDDCTNMAIMKNHVERHVVEEEQSALPEPEPLWK